MAESIRPLAGEVTEPRNPWTDATGDQVMDAAAEALRRGDMKAAAALITILAVKDPEAAEVVLAVLDAAGSGE